MVGVAGRGAITTPMRTLLAGAAPEDVVKAMDKVLPRPIDHFLLQADSTVVVPGASETLEFKAPDPGEYAFVCTLHPGMGGTLVVEAG